MSKKIFSGIVLTLLVLGMAMLALSMRPANAILIGDLNSDGKVDMKDLVIAAQAFGSTPGHPRWNASADLNGDLIVDLKDICIIAKNFI